MATRLQQQQIEDSMTNGQPVQAVAQLNECFDRVEMLDRINVSDTEMAFSLSKLLIKKLLK